MKVTVWKVHDNCANWHEYIAWTKKEAMVLKRKLAKELPNDKFDIEKIVIKGTTQRVCTDLINLGIDISGGHAYSWIMY